MPDLIDEPLLAPFDLDLSQALCPQSAIVKEACNRSISERSFTAVDVSQGPTRCQRRHITHVGIFEVQLVQSLARCQRRHITHLSIVEFQRVQSLA
jgi:hypothetical protein